MIDATYDVQPLFISAPDNYQYRSNYEVPRNKGFEYAIDLVRIKDNETNNNNNNNNNSQRDLSTLVATASLTPRQNAPYNKIYSSLSFQGKQCHYNEGSLIDQLEERGIGRPSTMSMLVDIIQQRSYVLKRDISGKRVNITEHTLTASSLGKPAEIISESKEKEIGGEKQKLVIENIGTDVIQFLMEHFEPIFNYDYTKTMEDDLDKISTAPISEDAHSLMSELCKKMDREIQALIKELKKVSPEKISFPLADTNDYVVVYQKGQAVLKQVKREEKKEEVGENKKEEAGEEKKKKGKKNETGEKKTKEEEKPIFKSIKKGIIIDKEKLERGEYTYQELVEIDNNCLGEYNGIRIYLKTGKYGPYLEYTPEPQNGQDTETKRIAIQTIKNVGEIKMEDVIKYLDGSGTGRKPLAKTVMREFGDDLSVRIGKHGPYLYYKTAIMTKPDFYSLKGFQSKGVRDICSAVRICDKSEMLEFFKGVSGGGK
jgi:DNA topoisomerase-1